MEQVAENVSPRHEPATNRQDLALLILRCGIGATFVLLGVHKIQEPGYWIMFVPTELLRIVTAAGFFSVDTMLRTQGVFEVAVGVLLAIGLAVRVAAALASTLLCAIIVATGLDMIGARDVGLLGGTLSLALTGAGRFAFAAALPGARRMPEMIAWHAWTRRAAWGGIAAAVAWILVPGPPGPDRPILGEVATSEAAELRLARLPIPPLPAKIVVDPLRAELGGKLFRDVRLSRDGTVACASCHEIQKGGGDGRERAVGIGGQVGEVNTPTVLNAALNFKQFWDGRADNLEDQAAGPIVNPKEMGSTWEDVLRMLSKDREYAALFGRSFPDGITQRNLLVALAEFERSLVTPDSPFDRSLQGDAAALTPIQKRGYEAFVSLGCISCHQGANVGGNTFQTMGKMEDYFAGRALRPADLGRFNVTHDPRDKYKFKVPSLRNVALTAPYFHDGSAATLPDAVNAMARYQLGQRLTYAETADLVAFLESLTGKVPVQ